MSVRHNLLSIRGSEKGMKPLCAFSLPLLLAVLSAVPGSAQEAREAQAPYAETQPSSAAQGPVDLEWVPPALTELRAQATSRSSFSLDRSMLSAVAGLMPDSDPETRQAIAKLDGVSVHLLRFGSENAVDPGAVDAIRQAYRLRGWKHLGSQSVAPRRGAATGAAALARSQTSDVWLVMDGVNIRGGVVLVETPRSLTLVTVAGNVSPVDLLHLRGHFGIPRLDGDDLKESAGR